MNKKGCIAFLLGLLIAVVWGLYAITPAHAEYVPNDETIARLSEHATMLEDFGIKMLAAGNPFQTGTAAYFYTAGQGTWGLFLERWESPTKAVTYQMNSVRAVKRVKVYEDTDLNIEASGKEEEIPITSKEAIQASEQAQKILLKHAGEQEL